MAKNDAEGAKELALSSMNALTREIESLRKTSDGGQKDIENLMREKQNIDKNLEVTKKKNDDKENRI